MSTTIVSNGYPAGAHDIEVLFGLLGQHQLDPMMNVIEHQGLGIFRFAGNFLKHSHAFQIRSTDADLVACLYGAITANRSRSDYVADVAYRESAAVDYHAGLQATGNDEAYRAARREWFATRPPAAGVIAGAPNIAPELAARLAGHRVIGHRMDDAAEDTPVAKPASRRARP